MSMRQECKVQEESKCEQTKEPINQQPNKPANGRRNEDTKRRQSNRAFWRTESELLRVADKRAERRILPMNGKRSERLRVCAHELHEYEILRNHKPARNDFSKT